MITRMQTLLAQNGASIDVSSIFMFGVKS